MNLKERLMVALDSLEVRDQARQAAVHSAQR